MREREFNRKYNATDARSTYLVSNGNGLCVETSSTGRIAIVLRVSRVSIRGGMSANDNEQIDILVSPDNIGLPLTFYLARCGNAVLCPGHG